METTYDAGTDALAAAASKTAQDVRDGAHSVKSVATEEIKSLIADVEDLIARIADLKDGDVVQLRERVMHAVDAAKETLAGGAETLRRQARRVWSGADEYVNESPWAAVGLAALVGAVVGILVTRRS